MNNQTAKTMQIVLLLFFGLALFFFALGAKDVYKQLLLLKNGVVIEAKVTAKKSVTGETTNTNRSGKHIRHTRSSYTNYFISAAFSEASGKKQVIELPANKSIFESTKEDSQIKILLDQKNPANACLYLRRYEPLQVGLIAMFFGPLCLVLFMYVKRRYAGA